MRISFKRFVEDELFVRKIAGSLAVRVKKRQNLIEYQAISPVPDFTSLPFFAVLLSGQTGDPTSARRGPIMTSLSARALLSVGLLAGLVAGCHRPAGTASQPGPKRPDNSTVTSEEIQRQVSSDEPLEKVLQGRVAGVTVIRTANGIAVRIRGGSSVYGNNEPLYVIDGMPIQPGPNGALTGLNPYDIESIKVLKDAADTAMYGIRGANGVIVIKTKRPKLN
jgi:TonB-dependent SusC/RagA subfamily outer membrane receptor